MCKAFGIGIARNIPRIGEQQHGILQMRLSNLTEVAQNQISCPLCDWHNRKSEFTVEKPSKLQAHVSLKRDFSPDLSLIKEWT